MIAFDPFAWLEKITPAKTIHLLIRCVMVGVCGFFLFYRLMEYPLYALKPLWFVETLIYMVLISAFAGRIPPVGRSRGVKEILVPVMGGLLPFALLFSPPYRGIYENPFILGCVFWWMTVATSFTLWAMWTLRRSFSITVEARALITGGPYRWIRHPIYLGEILCAGAIMIWRFSYVNLIIFFLFIVIQLARAKWEEKKLMRFFPKYREYRQKSIWI